ncbi:zinc-dependent peptidase [Maribacter stanieri]|uniref:Glucose-regulated metallo-peptidase M90 n=1 Tax=Maribacter stanieri TaxID=440514 RepID=A0A1I6KDI3_9FLAO|nr:zinc-dependent peptidase [Maribacter stanieri]SFR89068.1 Glucose-regulated metallo-peptidase M90 [Maribacter stanieri]
MNAKHTFVNLFLKRSSKQECHIVLSRWNTYYEALSEKHKKTFVVRTLLFLNTTDFDSKEGFELTLEMKLVISSAFVQITFGLKQDVLRIFNTIFVTPTSYKYASRDVFFNGDVNTVTKRVNLSWPAVEKGFIITNDGLNIAIHEFAHCLIIENTKRSRLSKNINQNDLNQWKDIATKKLPLIREGKYKIFRNYGGTNLMELFATTLETFFEQPHEFYSYAPTFYRTTAKVLKQDPRNGKNPK